MSLIDIRDCRRAERDHLDLKPQCLIITVAQSVLISASYFSSRCLLPIEGRVCGSFLNLGRGVAYIGYGVGN